MESSWKCWKECVGRNVLEVNVDGDFKLAGESVRFIQDVVVLFLVFCVVWMHTVRLWRCVGGAALPRMDVGRS